MSSLPVPKFKVGQFVRNTCSCGGCRLNGGSKKIWRVDSYDPLFQDYTLTRPGYVGRLELEECFLTDALTDAMPINLPEDML